MVEKFVRDKSTSTYDTLLNFDTMVTPDDLVGTYTCSVFNSAGQSNMESVSIKGISVTIESYALTYVLIQSLLYPVGTCAAWVK